ncbi:phosphoglycerate kinase, partial [bacterium]|nr:phosphoglycerate kinase [bacterium]
ANLGEIYVNDAFGTAHRAHASTKGVANFLPSVAGLLMEKEIEYLGKVLENPARPFVAILGGAKVSDKIGVIENLLDKVDSLLIGGAMAYTFLRAKGKEMGDSLVEEDKMDMAKDLLERAEEKGVPFLLPVDHIIADKFSEEAQVKTADEDVIPSGWRGMDVGEKTIVQFSQALQGVKTVLWNGPLGVFEMAPFSKGTERMAKVLAELRATTIVGGGHSVAAISKLGLSGHFTHISTGGGASLEFLEGKVLPGIAVLADV